MKPVFSILTLRVELSPTITLAVPLDTNLPSTYILASLSALMVIFLFRAKALSEKILNKRMVNDNNNYLCQALLLCRESYFMQVIMPFHHQK
jgi:hypothetical protein